MMTAEASKELEVIPDKPQDPRPYQDSIFRKAIKENVIAFMETGTGKTLIACLLAKHYAEPVDNIDPKLYEKLAGQRKTGALNQSNLLEALPKLNKKVLFLVPKTPLVKQQAIQLRKNADIVVKEYHGNIEHFQIKDIEDAALWHRDFSQAQAFVMTPQILLNLLKVGFIKLANISLLILDECHHCNGEHTYVHIMKEYYQPCQNRPRLFGMTASPLATRFHSDIKLEQAIDQLQQTMLSKIVTVDPMVLDEYAPRATTHLLSYEPYLPMFDLEFIKHFKPSTPVQDPIYRAYLTYRYKATPKQQRDADYICGELGVYLAATFLGADIDLATIDPILHVSNKCNTFVQQLNKSFSQNVRCICFINRKCVCSILYTFLLLLQNQDIIPYNTCPGVLQADLSNRDKLQVLTQFNNGTVNLLLTTSVAEEGLDITACSIVYMFDIPTTSKSLIQTRGRARQANSEYILFVKDGDHSLTESIAALHAQELYQSAKLRTLQLSIHPQYQQYYKQSIECNDVLNVLRLPNAVCFKHDAIQKLNHYLSSVKGTLEFKTVLTPGRIQLQVMQMYLLKRKNQKMQDEMDVNLDNYYKDSGTMMNYLYAFELKFTNCHIESVLSPPCLLSQDAKQLGALLAIKQIYLNNGLDELLLPINTAKLDKLNKLLTSSKFVQPINKIMVGTGEDYGVDAFDQLMDHETEQLYRKVTSSHFKKKDNDTWYVIAVTFGPEIQGYLESTKLKSFGFLSLKPMKTARTLIWIRQQVPCQVEYRCLGQIKMELKDVVAFNETFIKLTLRGYVGDIEMDKRHYMYDTGIYVVPLVAEGNQSVVEPKLTALDAESINYQYNLITHEINHIDWQVDYDLINNIDSCTDITDLNCLHCISFNTLYFVQNTIKKDINELVKKDCTYIQYYKQHYNMDLTNKSGLMFEVKQSYQLRQHQIPNAHIKNKIRSPIYLPLEVCKSPRVPVEYMKLNNLIFAVFYALECHGHALDLEEMFNVEIPYQALVHSESFGNNYERLEFLGDSVLKHLVGQFLYLKHSDYNQGQLSKARDALVRNSNLFEISKKFNLPSFCLFKIYHPRVTGVYYGKTSQVEQPLSIYEQWDGQRFMKNKDCADLVESIIGGVYCTSGIDGCQLLLKHLDIIDEILTPIPQEIYGSNELHSSAFERLEYLGDGVLDCMSAHYAYVNYALATPGDLTRFKQGIVENKAFSKSCFLMGLYKHYTTNVIGENQFFDMISQISQVSEYLELCNEVKATKLMGDIFEAYCGQLFVNSGIESVWERINAMLTELLIQDTNTNKSQKQKMEMYLQRLKIDGELSMVIDKEGDMYKCTMLLEEEIIGVGMDSSLDNAKVKSSWEGMSKYLGKKELYRFKMERSRETVIQNIFGEMKYLKELQ